MRTSRQGHRAGLGAGSHVGALAGCVALLTVLLVGCSSGSGTSATSLSSQPATSSRRASAATAAYTKWASCMREHGVMVPNRRTARSGPPLERSTGTSVREAFEKCRNLVPGERRELGKIDRMKLRDAAVAYAACMRVNGFEMPDPASSLHSTRSTDGGAEGGAAAFRSLFGNANTNDPAFERADKVCRPALRKALGMDEAHS